MSNVPVAHPASSGTAYTTFYTQVARLGGDGRRPSTTWPAP